MEQLNNASKIKQKIAALVEKITQFKKVKSALEQKIAKEDPDRRLRELKSKLEAVRFDIFRKKFVGKTSTSQETPVVQSDPRMNRSR